MRFPRVYIWFGEGGGRERGVSQQRSKANTRSTHSCFDSLEEFIRSIFVLCAAQLKKNFAVGGRKGRKGWEIHRQRWS